MFTDTSKDFINPFILASVLQGLTQLQEQPSKIIPFSDMVFYYLHRRSGVPFLDNYLGVIDEIINRLQHVESEVKTPEQVTTRHLPAGNWTENYGPAIGRLSQVFEEMLTKMSEIGLDKNTGVNYENITMEFYKGGFKAVGFFGKYTLLRQIARRERDDPVRDEKLKLLDSLNTGTATSRFSG